MELGREILYLSDAEIAAADMSKRELAEAVDDMLKQKATGRTVSKPKLGLYPKPGTFFQAMSGVMEEPPFAGVKWASVVHDNAERGLPSISPIIQLHDTESAQPVALMGGRWITAHRTAAITLVAATYLARPESESIGFIACGVQARSHLEAFRQVFPLKRVVAYSRKRATAEAFANEVAESGLDVVVTEDPMKAVEGQDIVITSVPESPSLKPFLDSNWVSPGSFAGMCDVARPWHGDRIRVLDLVATDDHDQSAYMAKSGRLHFKEPFDADLAELAGGKKPGRTSDEQRTGLIYSGLALADVAVAGRLYRRAIENGWGTILPL
ncbi:MAG: ornithine cyclodeaminase family protein [Proteobacteria bacterium]|nr:ornithine cyclodeaminase family protein [Pseudomonadota bacterium]